MLGPPDATPKRPWWKPLAGLLRVASNSASGTSWERRPSSSGSDAPSLGSGLRPNSRGWFGNDRWELIWAHDGKCSACQSASRFGLILPSMTKTPGAPSATHALTDSRSASVRTVVPRAP